MSPSESVLSVESSGLHWVDDSMPGLRRWRRAVGWVYGDAKGRPVGDPATLHRIEALQLPPAWAQVWICQSERGHLQATGRDGRGRKHYRYHWRWLELCHESDFDRIFSFAEALPKIRARVARDLLGPKLGRRKVVAASVALLERTRPKLGRFFIHGDGLHRFELHSKTGAAHRVTIDDARLAHVVRRCHELPGESLFLYLGDDGRPHAVGSADLNEYLCEVTGERVTARDFRLWAGTVHAAIFLQRQAPARTGIEAKRHLMDAIRETATHLESPAAVCRKRYIHPAVIGLCLARRGFGPVPLHAASLGAGLSPEERAVLSLLRRRTGARPRAATSWAPTAAS